MILILLSEAIFASSNIRVFIGSYVPLVDLILLIILTPPIINCQAGGPAACSLLANKWLWAARTCSKARRPNFPFVSSFLPSTLSPSLSAVHRFCARASSPVAPPLHSFIHLNPLNSISPSSWSSLISSHHSYRLLDFDDEDSTLGNRFVPCSVGPCNQLSSPSWFQWTNIHSKLSRRQCRRYN